MTSSAENISMANRITAAVYIFGIDLVICITTLIGRKNTLRLGKGIGTLLYTFSRRTKNKVLHNLGLAYAEEISVTEKKRLAKKVLQNFGKNWAELFFCGGPSRDRVRNKITIEGIDHLDNALKKGSGAVAISAHIGNYALIGSVFSKRGYDFHTVIRNLKTVSGSIAYTRARERIELPSIPTLPEKQFYKTALKILRRNGILCLIADENKRHGGVFVDFFGRSASTAPGPAGLALRTGAALIPVFMVRNCDDSQKIIIDREIHWQKTGRPETEAETITAAFTRRIEHCVREHPDQWLWTNFRWRTQPEGQSREAKIRKKKIIRKLTKKLAGKIYRQ